MGFKVIGQAPQVPVYQLIASDSHVVSLAAVLRIPEDRRADMLNPMITCWCNDGKHKMVRDNFRVDDC